MKRLKQANQNICMNIRDILAILNDMDDEQIITVEEQFTGEKATGKLQDIYQWIIDINNNFEGKCKFELL